MKIPRDISGKYLSGKLVHFGYKITRQSGSHMRLTTQQNGTHHITIPNHDYLRIGTISAILTDVSGHLQIEKQKLIIMLFD